MNEIIDERRRFGNSSVVFKINFEKACDHVGWDLFYHALQKKDFNPKWRLWIYGCLSSASFAILMNGCAGSCVKAFNGLRKGDPLSPFLFTIVAEVLNKVVVRVEDNGLLEGFLLSKDRMRMSLLQFVDIFFLSG